MKKKKEFAQKKTILSTHIVRTCTISLSVISLCTGAIPVAAKEQPSQTFMRQPAAKDASVSYDYVVTDYEVDGTDQESDRDEIQAVLNLAKGADKQITIYFPAGDYYIDRAPLHVYSNTHIILDQEATVHRMDSMLGRSIIHNADQNGAMDVVGGYEMSHDITLEGGTWDGGNIAKATEAADVIRFDHAENIVMKDCTVKNVYDCHLIEYVGVKNGSITGCTLTGFRYRQGKEKNYLFAREAIQLETAWTNNPDDMGDTDSFWANGSVVDGTSCQQVTVSNNTFIDMPCGVGQHHYTTDGKYQNQDITISDNNLTCSTNMKYCKTAITCGGMNTVTIARNTITGPYRFGIHITQADMVMVLENTISGSSQNGIMMDGGTVKNISENSISNTAKHGISIGDGTLSTLSDNEVSNVGQNGISVGKGTIDNILNNQITNTTKHGISVTDGATINSMTNNTIKNANYDGIVLGKGTIKLLRKNTIQTTKVHGISITGGTIGVGKNKSKGIMNNTITNCKQNAISISREGTVSSIRSNTIKKIGKNGISIIDGGVAYWIISNTIKNCKNHGILNNSSRKKATLKNNKGQTN